MTDTAFTDEEVKDFREIFEAFDADGNNTIDSNELADVLKKLSLYEGEEQVKQLIASVDQDGNNTISFDEFLVILHNEKSGKAGSDSSGFLNVIHESKKLITLKGASGLHSFAQEEMTAFANHVNHCLEGDADLSHVLPIDPSGLALCDAVSDGILLCKLINLAEPQTIDERVINRPKSGGSLSVYQRAENGNLAIQAAKSIGVNTVNIGHGELEHGREHPHLVLGLVWQIVRLQLLNSINLKNHPELVRLLEDGEELSDLLKLPPEQLLLRWVNYHLKNAGHPRRVNNFGGDVKDSEAYTVLLHQISGGQCDKSALGDSNLTNRANKVLDNSRKVGVNPILKASDICAGNRRLNTAFVAAMFNACPALEELDEEELEKAGLLDDEGDSREERAFRLYFNSLALADVYVNHLFEDCKDGLVLLKVLDRVQPGIVDWHRVEMKPTNRFKKVANCNYCIVLGKELHFSLVGIGGIDITDGNKKLTLALCWQIMRLHVLKILQEMQSSRFSGREVTDSMLVEWANQTVKDAGREGSMSSFRDKSLADSVFFINLLAAVEPRVIDWDLVTDGSTEEDRILNARYALSVARKLGCTLFLLPEDIVEVRSKMIMTFVASVAARK